jgi:CubicO group peptidase (beta-lactamase class C family)
MSSSAIIDGSTSPRFGVLADRFRRNFTDHGEIGAALCVFHRGEMVVDLWGGVRDEATGARWEQHTMAPVFSTGKGLLSLTAALALSRRRLRLDDPVSTYWPGFAGAGKERTTVADLLAHRAGLVLFGRPVTLDLLADPAAMIRVMEEMKPLWPPGHRWGYHLATFGELVAELLRRSDPRGRSFPRIFAEDVAAPLGLAFHFGLPDAIDDTRLARIRLPRLAGLLGALLRAPSGLGWQALNPASLLHRSLREVRGLDANDRRWMRHPFPSANGVGEVRAIAAAYACLAAGGAALGLDRETFDTITADPHVPPGGSRDMTMGVDGRWHLGFARPSPAFRFSPTPRAFGMPGLGGSFGFCDPDAGIGYAYAPNRLGLLPFDDPRERALREAVYGIVGKS